MLPLFPVAYDDDVSDTASHAFVHTGGTVRKSLRPAHHPMPRLIGRRPTKELTPQFFGSTRAREGITPQSFPSVSGQPNLLLPTFGSAWAINASVLFHRLQR